MEVGDSIEPGSFELLETNNRKKTEQSSESIDSKDLTRDIQPLEELLGREPVRGASTIGDSIPVSPESSRPFPSRLLRSE